MNGKTGVIQAKDTAPGAHDVKVPSAGSQCLGSRPLHRSPCKKMAGKGTTIVSDWMSPVGSLIRERRIGKEEATKKTSASESSSLIGSCHSRNKKKTKKDLTLAVTRKNP